MSLFNFFKNKKTKNNIILDKEIIEFSNLNLTVFFNGYKFYNTFSTDILELINKYNKVKDKIDNINLEDYSSNLKTNLIYVNEINVSVTKNNEKYIDNIVAQNRLDGTLLDFSSYDIIKTFSGEEMLTEDDIDSIYSKYNWLNVKEIVGFQQIHYLFNEKMYCNIHCLIHIKDYIKENNLIHSHSSSSTKEEFFDNSRYISKKELNLFIETNPSFIKYQDELNRLVETNNEKFIENKLIDEKEYLDNVLKESDPSICLDEEQRIAVLSDEDYTLIIAGAGAGKTTTVSAKVKYLVDKKDIKPEEILVVSFTNKAVNELKERINNDLKIPCPISTFHASGNAILRKTTSEKLNIAMDGFLYNIIREFIKNEVMTNDELLQKIILFFSYHINADINHDNIEEAKKKLSMGNIQTLKASINEINNKLMLENQVKKKTIKNEYVRSIEEVQIANFLFLNGIEYEYENEYQYHIHGSRKPYTPDFTLYKNAEKIYLEHFGITEDGKHSYYTDEELIKYKKSIIYKTGLHSFHNTKLICTYSKYNNGKTMLEMLEENLINEGFVFKKKNSKELYSTLIGDEDVKYFHPFIKLLMNFIHNFKTNGYTEKDFSILKNRSSSERNKIFLDIAKHVYLFYQSKLSLTNKVDFEDLINNSAEALENYKELKDKLSFKYIIVDEYQDISQQRFNLTKKLSEVTNAKIIAVGDDWQSIYAFSGSKLELFTKFKEEMGYANVLQITHTYRNSQQLIDIAGKFIQVNDSQIKKKLVSPKSLDYPVVVFSYSDDQKELKGKGRTGIIEEKANAINKALAAIVKRQKKDDSTILLIGRYSFDASRLDSSSTFSYDKNSHVLKSNLYPNIKFEFLTAHSSKGLGYDDVILINGEEGTYGFPSQIIDDPIMRLVLANDRSYEFAEERRLFYVALTRTKNRVYIIAPKLRPSRFVSELLEYDNAIYLDDEIHKGYKYVNSTIKNQCPVCGFPIHLVSKSMYPKKMWACSNDPEICDFLTNDLSGGCTRIRKCDKCTDGYLFIKRRKEDGEPFLGCTNFNRNGTGCENSEQLDYDKCDELKDVLPF